ncbi:MAG: LysR family transcriptional regulator [Deltaproteobacteria bacterium]|nr:LysR family transcriptional regulator [Deltaproteobacteria bacterium]
MEFHDLEVFITVAREKSFSKAAKIMLRTQPAISLSIRRLEDEFNEKLFDRSSKEPQITYEGEILFQYAQKLLNMKSEVFQAINEVQELHRGHLKIAANEISVLPLLEHLSIFHRQYPKIFIEIMRHNSRDIPRLLNNHEVDFGVISYNIPDPNFESTLLFEDRICCVAYPDHDLARQDVVYSIKRLRNEKFAAHQSQSYYRNQVETLFDRYQVPLNIDIELPNIESIKIFIENKNAIVLLPLITVEPELKKGILKEIKIEETAEISLERKIQLIYRKSSNLSHSARAFISAVEAEAEKRFN